LCKGADALRVNRFDACGTSLRYRKGANIFADHYFSAPARKLCLGHLDSACCVRCPRSTPAHSSSSCILIQLGCNHPVIITKQIATVFRTQGGHNDAEMPQAAAAGHCSTTVHH
jgi:hypothetical protein